MTSSAPCCATDAQIRCSSCTRAPLPKGGPRASLTLVAAITPSALRAWPSTPAAAARDADVAGVAEVGVVGDAAAAAVAASSDPDAPVSASAAAGTVFWVLPPVVAAVCLAALRGKSQEAMVGDRRVREPRPCLQVRLGCPGCNSCAQCNSRLWLINFGQAT